MKINECIQITGEKVLLVPYERHHVPKYHRWMQSTELQELTASEPLTLQEEYAMQQSWRDDDDKCTFIILSKESHTESASDIESMVGDVNLFLNDLEDRTCGELEIMIAEPCHRGKGLGREALIAMIHYAITSLSMRKFTVKIGYDNVGSLKLFKNLSFIEVDRVEVFREVTLHLTVDDKFINGIKKLTDNLSIVPYNKVDHG